MSEKSKSHLLVFILEVEASKPVSSGQAVEALNKFVDSWNTIPTYKYTDKKRKVDYTVDISEVVDYDMCNLPEYDPPMETETP